MRQCGMCEKVLEENTIHYLYDGRGIDLWAARSYFPDHKLYCGGCNPVVQETKPQPPGANYPASYQPAVYPPPFVIEKKEPPVQLDTYQPVPIYKAKQEICNCLKPDYHMFITAYSDEGGGFYETFFCIGCHCTWTKCT